jgi:hypothetical protein
VFSLSLRGDLIEERKAAKSIVDDLNRLIAKMGWYEVELVG